MNAYRPGFKCRGEGARAGGGGWGGIIVCVLAAAVSLATPFEAMAKSDRPVFLHFFDWFAEKSWLEDQFVEPLDWAAVGTTPARIGTKDFYRKQFDYIRTIGVDSIAWEYNARTNASTSVPSAAALEALRESGLRVAPVFDLEISLQVYQKRATIQAEPSTAGLIAADDATTGLICRDLGLFFQQVPADLAGKDAEGHTVAFVFGFGFNDQEVGVAAWDAFADRLDACLAPVMGPRWKLYWVSTNHAFEEHLFLKHREHFTPWQFVSDMPQAQFGHDSVTWNFGFDNLGVERRDHSPRVIRVDPRYLEETAWLASAADPALVFLYGWNEPFESSFLFPTTTRGGLKADTARAYIADMRAGATPALPRVLVVVDDLDDLWGSRRGDWHLSLLREMLLYRLRLLAPQADVVTAAEVNAGLLERYDGVVDLVSRKTADYVAVIEGRPAGMRLLAFDPLTAGGGGSYHGWFLHDISYHPLNRNVSVLDTGGRRIGEVFTRDDVLGGTPCAECGVVLWADADGGLPLLVVHEGSVLLNSYANNDFLMTAAFEAFYGRPLGKSILYGEAYSSQRLEIDPNNVVTENHLLRGSVDRGLPLPYRKAWLQLPPDVPESEFRFLFGLDAMPITGMGTGVR